MIFLNTFIELVLDVAKMVFACKRKGIFDILIQVPLILFERQGIVSILLDDLRGNRPLCSYGINGDDASFQCQEF